MSVEKLGRPRDCVSVSNFAVLSNIPQDGKVRLVDHLLPYQGQENCRLDGLIWGVTGTVSQNNALLAVHAEAADKRCVILPLTVWYRFEGFSLGRQQGMICRGAKEPSYTRAEYLHLGRLVQSERVKLAYEIYEAIERDFGAKERAKAVALDWIHLLATYPQYVIDLFELHPAIKMIIHPVYSSYPGFEATPPWSVATMRRDKKRIDAARVNYADELQLVV